MKPDLSNETICLNISSDMVAFYIFRRTWEYTSEWMKYFLKDFCNNMKKSAVTWKMLKFIKTSVGVNIQFLMQGKKLKV